MHNKQLIQRLRKEGHRLTGIRKGIIGIFKESKKPISVTEIGGLLKVMKIEADKATLYRSINFLKNKQIINEIDFGDGKKHYETAAGHHHHHLVCLKCGGVEDVTLGRELEDEERIIENEKKFKVLRHALEFFGICGRCVGPVINK
jgi:Fur family transcriptional regulator, ferric uptake regulator